MNIKATALIVILGLCTPAITDLAINLPALAQEPAPLVPLGGFTDGLWSVAIWRKNNLYNYSIKNYQTGAALFLSDVKETIENDRRIYNWSDGRNNYQIVWEWVEQNQPRAIRLQVFALDGREILNRLMVRQFK